MHCPSCNTENPEGTRFCTHCGARFEHSCARCGFDNPPQAKFCAQCGTALTSFGLIADSAEHGRTSYDDLKPRGGREGERRHLTVLFCDLVGSTAIASRLDPEEWGEMAAGYRHTAAEEITRFGGQVAQYVGDGVMAFFGYPEAHDNDAERAARAGLALLEALDRLNQQPRYAKLSARIGIDSGAVVVQDTDIFGDAPNIAARVQAAAAPGTVVISATTLRLVAGLFIVEELGAHALKGVDRSVQLYRVVRPSGVRGRLEAAAAAGALTPFVGRADELRLLVSRWERVRKGEGQVVTIIGEQGIGKSRLLRRFHQEIATTPHTWIEAGAGAFFQNTPFYPISELLQQIMADTPGQEPLVQLEARLEVAGLEPAEAVPLIAPLLNLPPSAKYPPLASSPEQQRRRLLATLVAWTLAAAKAQPLVVATEDLHWVDPSTLELIQLLVEQGMAAPLLLLYTARPEFHPPWPLRAHHTQIMLNRLSAHDARRMVGQVMMHQALLETTIATVVERTGGVPLFVEELTRAILENGAARLTERTIPVTLHDSLMTRLDRLGPAREVIQIGAVLGDDFSYPLLHAVYPVAEEKLQAALRKLADAELLYVHGVPPDATYQFKHALIRDAAYEALLKSRRKELHRTVARIIDERFPILKETHPEVLARHWTEADMKEQAILQWQRAGHNAMQRSANAEAVSHLTKALELLETLPESPSRAQQELVLRITLAVPLTQIKGYAAPEVEQVYNQAREIYQQVGESPQLFPMLVHLWTFYSVRAEYNTARELGAQVMSSAQSAQDPALLIQAHAMRGNTLCFLGELVLARGHLEQAIALYDPQQHQSQAFVYGTDPGVHSLSYAALALWLLGYPEQARKRSLDALALAQKFSHPYSVAFALVHVLYIHRFSREVKATQARAQELVALSIKHGFPLTLAVGAAHRGWALAEQGQGEEGILQIRQSIDNWRATGSTLFFEPFLLAMLAEAQAKAQLPEEGLSMLAEALAIVNKTGERFWEAELYRLKGELTLQAQLRSSQFKVQDEVEECFHRAIDIAAHQSAKSLELRAVMSLSRLWQHQGKTAQARQVLAEVYEWFTEGFDTIDLKEARILLKDGF